MSRLFKRIHLSVVTPKKIVRRIISAPPTRAFHDLGIENELAQFAADLERMNPGVEFRLVPLGTNRFNFICQACDAGMEAAS